MSPYTSGIADILITVATIVTQILIARWFFSARKKLPAPVAWVLTCILFGLWAAFLFATPFRFAALGRRLRWMPPTVHGTLIAAGNLWGMTAVASGCHLRSVPFLRLPRRAGALHRNVGD